jgi:hypothetical protein
MAGAIFMFGPSPYPAWTGPVAVAVDGAPAEPGLRRRASWDTQSFHTIIRLFTVSVPLNGRLKRKVEALLP